MTNQMSNSNAPLAEHQSTTSFRKTTSPALNPSNEILPAADVQSEVIVDLESPPQDLLLDTRKPASTKTEPTSDSRASKNFTLFPKLPVELRIIIWQFALTTRRYVSVQHDRPRSLYIRKPTTWHPCCADRAPAPFFVCHEAWQEVTKVYKPLKGSTLGSESVWMDAKKDVLCILRREFVHDEMNKFVDGFPMDFRNDFTYIAADDILMRYWSNYDASFVDKFYKFPALASLTVLDHKIRRVIISEGFRRL